MPRWIVSDFPFLFCKIGEHLFSEIKSAYRKNAKILHPDVSDEPDSQERFSELGQAYEVSDSE
jgi:hypothetical protein